MVQPSQQAGKSLLTQEAFDKLLAALATDDRERAGAKYTELRDELCRLFDWRGCPYPEDHADETLNRTARRLAGGEQIVDVRHYAFGVARLLVLEIYREEERKRLALAELPTVIEVDADDEAETRLRCLQSCLQKLPQENRELIVHYYQGERAGKIANRQELAARLGLTLNTLRMRALRLRAGLEKCVAVCAGRENLM